MKLSEIARYWAAKELTRITAVENKITLNAPFSTPGFTVRLNSSTRNPIVKIPGYQPKSLLRVNDKKEIKSNTFYTDRNDSVLCFDLVKGNSELDL
jgi:hypothetical protein